MSRVMNLLVYVLSYVSYTFTLGSLAPVEGTSESVIRAIGGVALSILIMLFYRELHTKNKED